MNSIMLHVRVRAGVYGASYIALTGNIGNTVGCIASVNGIILFPFK